MSGFDELLKRSVIIARAELTALRERAEKAEKELRGYQVCGSCIGGEHQNCIKGLRCKCPSCVDEHNATMIQLYKDLHDKLTTAESRIKELEGRLEEAKNILSGIWIHRCACVVCADNSISLLKEIESSLPDGQTGKEKG